jgi:hypothetical protein
MKNELLEKIKKEGGYQDVEIGGIKEWNGWRNCDDRWDVIKPALSGAKTMLDFGSHYGFFSLRAARELGIAVLSIEGGEARAEIQQDVLRENNEKRVALCRRQMGLPDWIGLLRSCEGIDAILALSVMHYFSPAELISMLWIFSQISPVLVVEWPRPEENAPNANWTREIGDLSDKLAMFYEDIQKIAEKPGAKPGSMRTIYRASNKKIFRNAAGSYLTFKNRTRKHALANFGGKWCLDMQMPGAWKPGINLQTMLELGLIWPDKEMLAKEITEKYWALLKTTAGILTDVHPRNVIFGPAGLEILDFTESAGQDIYGVAWEQYRNMLLTIEESRLREIISNRINGGD